MTLSTTIIDANERSRVFRQSIRSSIISVDPAAQVSLEQGNQPVRLENALKPWAKTRHSFKGAELGVPILVNFTRISPFYLGIQPVQQEGRGNAYQNALFRIAATATVMPVPIAVVIPDGDELSGYNEPGYFFRWWQELALASHNIRFAGTITEFRNWLDLQVIVKTGAA